MLRLGNINLDQNPDLIQPPKIDDNIVCIRLIADSNDIIAADIVDVALSYSIAGIDVILEIPFETRAEFSNEPLASLVSNGAWSLSLLPPVKHSVVLANEYCKEVIEWYKLWRSPVMRNFEQAIYPVTPFVEYLATSYLIDKNKAGLANEDIQELTELSQNPSHPYLLELIDNMRISVVNDFKDALELFIQQDDKGFYQDVDLLASIEI